MEKSIAVALFLFYSSYIWTPVFSFFSEGELQSYSVFVKPYGVNFTAVTKLSPGIRSCIENHADLRTCNNASVNLTGGTSRPELAQMFEECPAGQLGCFQSQANSSSTLRVILKHVKAVMKRLCSGQCWRKLASATRSCIRRNGTVVKAAEQNALLSFSDVLGSTCLTQRAVGPMCAEKLIDQVLDIKNMGDPNNKVCNVSENVLVGMKKCTSACYEELQQFYKNLGCCVGSMKNIVDCHNIQINGQSFGALVMESDSLCHLKPPGPCKQMPCQNGQLPSTASPAASTHVLMQTSTKIVTTASGHHPATEIAGICIASFVVVVGLIILGRFIYQRIKKREKVHLEDYGYSRLKMIEDDLYNDFTDDSDFEGFVNT